MLEVGDAFLVERIVFTVNPASAADAGLVPCAESGINITRRSFEASPSRLSRNARISMTPRHLTLCTCGGLK
jgi:hypothetical protein